MTKKEEDTLQTTDLTTLWSDTLLEMLNDAVQNDWSTNALMEILMELHNKGYKLGRVVRKIEKKYGQESAAKLKEKINLKHQGD